MMMMNCYLEDLRHIDASAFEIDGAYEEIYGITVEMPATLGGGLIGIRLPRRSLGTKLQAIIISVAPHMYPALHALVTLLLQRWPTADIWMRSELPKSVGLPQVADLDVSGAVRWLFHNERTTMKNLMKTLDLSLGLEGIELSVSMLAPGEVGVLVIRGAITSGQWDLVVDWKLRTPALADYVLMHLEPGEELTQEALPKLSDANLRLLGLQRIPPADAQCIVGPAVYEVTGTTDTFGSVDLGWPPHHHYVRGKLNRR